MYIPRGLLDRLIQIGREEHFAELDSIPTLFPSAMRGDFMRLRPEAWTQAVADLSDDDIVCLIKSLTKMEHYPNYKAGSVSPVIWIFRTLPDARNRVDLINWILANTNNHYLPFGSSNHGAKSLEEYQSFSDLVAARGAARRKAEQDRQTAAKERKAAEASQRLFGAIRRKDEKAVKALMARGADFNIRDASGRTALQQVVAVGLGYLLNANDPQHDT